MIDQAARPLLLHYHLFKNAGSSVDAMLRENFPTAWANEEFPVLRRANRDAVGAYIAGHPELEAMSSHTALLPVPQVAGRTIFPIVFVRHPLLRLRSVYAFLHEEAGEAPPTKLARENDLAGFLTAMLERPKDRQVRNFQCGRLASGMAGSAPERDRAIATVDRLPFVGLVEDYYQSIAQLELLVRPLFPNFRAVPFHRNARETLVPIAVDTNLARLRDAIGTALYDELEEANADDLALHSHVAAQRADRSRVAESAPVAPVRGS